MNGLVNNLPREFLDVPAAIYGLSVLSSMANDELSLACFNQWGVRPVLAQSEQSLAGLVSGYEVPNKLGVDRWMGLIAVGPSNERTCIVLCGTAITLDIVEKGCHEGGYIIPGKLLMMQALRSGTQGIRSTDAGEGSLSPGRNTDEAVIRGVMLSLSGLIEKVVRQERVARLVLSGGDAALVSSCLSSSHFLDPELLLKGLRIYFEASSNTHNQNIE
jgi:type III pantothenate kinase